MPRTRSIRGAGHSDAFARFHRAILDQSQVVCRYQGLRREVCPYILGHSSGEEKALVFQFAGESRSKLPPGGQWRCLYLDDVTDIETRAGPWHGDAPHHSRQSCVDHVYVDVNTSVPNQPGRA